MIKGQCVFCWWQVQIVPLRPVVDGDATAEQEARNLSHLNSAEYIANFQQKLNVASMNGQF